MRRNILIVTFVTLFTFLTLAKSNDPLSRLRNKPTNSEVEQEPKVERNLNPELEYEKTLMTLVTLMSKYHYSGHPNLDDSFSKKLFNAYMKMLDGEKVVFTQAQADSMKKDYEIYLDDEIRQGKLDSAYAMYLSFLNEKEKYWNNKQSLLESDLELAWNVNSSKAGEKSKEYEDLKYPVSENDRQKAWKELFYEQVAASKQNDLTKEETRKNIETVVEGARKQIELLTSKDIFSVYMKVYFSSIEAHSAYHAPQDSGVSQIDIDMSLSLIGIGAVLGTENGFAVIQEVAENGGAAASAMIFPGDKIVAVTEGKTNSGDAINVVGWPLDKVVNLLRSSKENSIVTLTLLREGETDRSKAVSVEVTRKKVTFERMAAKGEIIELGNKKKVGVIRLPGFYRDFNCFHQGYRNCRSVTEDTKKQLDKLMEEGITGLVLDLRGNGGGALTEAQKLTGLFIKEGDVVAQKDKKEPPEILTDDDNGELYFPGPMAVVVDRSSASASEIVSGALYDHGRAVTLGEQTFGKGTVQTIVDLSRFMPDISGQLRITIAKFFLPSGNSTQLEGVKPDWQLPMVSSVGKTTEREIPNVLGWEKIELGWKDKRSYIESLIPNIKKSSDKRVADDADLRFLSQMRDHLSNVKEDSSPNDYRAKVVKIENERRRAKGMAETSIEELYKPEARELRWWNTLGDNKDLASDNILVEAANVVNDLANSWDYQKWAAQ